MSHRPPPPQRPYDRERVPPPPRRYDDRGGNDRYPASSSSSATRRSRSPDARGGYRDRDRQSERDPVPSRPHGFGPPDRTVPPPRDYRSAGGYAPRDGRDGYSGGYEREAPPGRGFVPPPRDAAPSSSRDRDRDRERDRDRDYDRDRQRDRDGYRDERAARPSGKREGDRERDGDARGSHQGRNGDKTEAKAVSQDPEVGEGAGEEGEEAGQTEEDMMAAMGFGGFGTTKNHKVEGNATGSANVKKERTWRQYMNRKGGFNRPLDALPKDK